MKKVVSSALILGIGGSVGGCCASAELSKNDSVNLKYLKCSGIDEIKVVRNKKNFGGKDEKIKGGFEPQELKP